MSQVTIRYLIDSSQVLLLALIAALAVRSRHIIQNEVPPRKATATDEVGLSRLSDLQLAQRWVEAMRLREDTTEILAEFNVRAWRRYEEQAEDGSNSVSMPPR